MQYSRKFMHYFLNTPHAGDLVGDDVIQLQHESHSPFDQFCFYIRLEGDTIQQVAFTSSTTPVLIAAGEYVSQYIEHRTIKEALSLQKEQILQELGLDNRFIHIVDLITRLLGRL